MKIKKLSPFILAFVLAGCIPVMSLNPLYDDKHLAFDEKLLGTFTEPNNITWQFERSNEPNAYQLTFTTVEDHNAVKGLFTARLVKLDDRLFFDVFPKESPQGNETDNEKIKWPYNSFFLISAHTFIKVETIEPQLKLYLTDDDVMKKLLSENPDAIASVSVNNTVVLTAPTDKLQSFVLKYADDNRLFPGEHILTPKKSEIAPDVNETPKDANEMPV